MGSAVLNPSGASAAANWTNPGNALYSDGGLYATNASGNGYLYFDFATYSLPAGATVVGVSIEAKIANALFGQAAIEFGTTPRLELSVSGDAGGSWSARKLADAGHNLSAPAEVLGGAADMWGVSLPPSVFASGSFMVRARRPQDADESGGSRYVESIRATVWWTDAPETLCAVAIHEIIKLRADTVVMHTKGNNRSGNLLNVLLCKLHVPEDIFLNPPHAFLNSTVMFVYKRLKSSLVLKTF